LAEPLLFDNPALAERAHWVEPRLVAEVQFTEWTSDGTIRHPSLQGFCTDRRPAEVRREREDGLDELAQPNVPRPALAMRSEAAL